MMTDPPTNIIPSSSSPPEQQASPSTGALGSLTCEFGRGAGRLLVLGAAGMHSRGVVGVSDATAGTHDSSYAIIPLPS
jgi:hypothetical protein